MNLVQNGEKNDWKLNWDSKILSLFFLGGFYHWKQVTNWTICSVYDNPLFVFFLVNAITTTNDSYQWFFMTYEHGLTTNQMEKKRSKTTKSVPVEKILEQQSRYDW